MALPKLKSAVIEHNETLLTGRKIKIRPFHGREEKKILTAKMSGTPIEQFDVIIEVMSTCVSQDVLQFSMAEFEQAYLILYSVSVNDKIEASFVCGECQAIISASIPVSAVKMGEDIGKTTTIDLGQDETGKNVTMVLNQLSVATSRMVMSAEDDSEIVAIFDSLEGIYVGEDQIESPELEEFGEWLLNQPNAYTESIKTIRTSPQMSYSKKWQCPDGHDNVTEVKGFSSFFRS